MIYYCCIFIKYSNNLYNFLYPTIKLYSENPKELSKCRDDCETELNKFIVKLVKNKEKIPENTDFAYTKDNMEKYKKEYLKLFEDNDYYFISYITSKYTVKNNP